MWTRNNKVVAGLFLDWHPHFTPEWLCHRIASYLPRDFAGAIIDPACGAGNLLAAAAIRTRAINRANDVKFVGIDTSSKAVAACKDSLDVLLPAGTVQVKHADFLTTQNARPSSERVAVVMNPPFKGYGAISRTRRERISRLLRLRGRFNLGHAFVHQALALYKPEILVALLPSNWAHSKQCPFRQALDELNGVWDWIDIGAEVFQGIDAHVGILAWRSRTNIYPARPSRNRSASQTNTLGEVQVRQGVATGRDALFRELSGLSLPFGTNVRAIRGRDVERAAGSKLWMPPRKPTEKHAKLFALHAPKDVVKELGSRTCVVDREKHVFEFHESLPSWFLNVPKILIPEISTGSIRVELDSEGKKLPLHSVIAVRVPNRAAGERMRRFLKAEKQQRHLLQTGPRLSGGAVRLQVGTLRELLAVWTSTSRKKSKPTRRA
jgi:SAM-dependent methyltransferase